jgi:hypothetical protein
MSIDDALAQNEAVMAASARPASDYVTPEGSVVTEDAVNEAAIESVVSPVIAYDPILGPVDAASYDESEPVMIERPAAEDPEPEAGEDDAELRAAIINDQMSSAEGVQGTADWQQALARQASKRQAQQQMQEKFAEFREFIGSHLVLPADMRDVMTGTLALWALGSYAYRKFSVYPYLFVAAPTRGAGKTRVLEVLDAVVSNTAGITTVPTATTLRLDAAEGRTIFVDEVDEGKIKSAEIAAVINSGYRASGSVKRSVARPKGEGGGRVNVEESTYSPKAFAAIMRGDKLPMAAATVERCIVLTIQKATQDEVRQVRKYSAQGTRRAARELREWAEEWAYAMDRELRDVVAEIPDLSSSRAAEIWESLLMVAEVIGIGDQARQWALALDGERDEEEADPNQLFIADIQTALTAWKESTQTGNGKISVEEFYQLWVTMDARSFTEALDKNRFSRRLAAFGSALKSMPDHGKRTIRILDATGEFVPGIADLFRRYAV